MILRCENNVLNYCFKYLFQIKGEDSLNDPLSHYQDFQIGQIIEADHLGHLHP